MREGGGTAYCEHLQPQKAGRSVPFHGMVHDAQPYGLAQEWRGSNAVAALHLQGWLRGQVIRRDHARIFRDSVFRIFRKGGFRGKNRGRENRESGILVGCFVRPGEVGSCERPPVWASKGGQNADSGIARLLAHRIRKHTPIAYPPRASTPPRQPCQPPPPTPGGECALNTWAKDGERVFCKPIWGMAGEPERIRGDCPLALCLYGD